MNWKEITEAYPVNDNFIWLNNCGTTPAGRHNTEALSRFINGYAEKGVLTETASYNDVRSRIKAILSRLLNCDPDELALIHHTAEGMNMISHGVSLEPEDEIILLENEYPSNVYPWLHWRDKGVIIRTAAYKDTPDAFFDAFSRMITPKTRLVSMSAVHWCTGMPLPLEKIGQLCRFNNIEFVVDGAQGVGMQPIDIRKYGIHYMAFSAWKWLMGPLGLGVMYVAKDKLESLNPIFIGTESVVQDEQYLPYKSQLKPSADRFTISTANFTDWVYFLSSLEFLDRIGFDVVRKRIFELSGYLNQRLRQIGFNVVSDAFPEIQTGITVCESPGSDADTIMDHLKDSRIVAAKRLGKIRFSPHIYLTTYQLDEVIRVLSRACVSQLYVKSLRNR